MKFDSLDSDFVCTRLHQVPSNRILTKLTLRLHLRSLSVHCEFSRIVCVSLFSYQCSLCLSFRQLIYFITFISVYQELFSFFEASFFETVFEVMCRSSRRLAYIITSSTACQQLFSVFLNFFVFLVLQNFLVKTCIFFCQEPDGIRMIIFSPFFSAAVNTGICFLRRACTTGYVSNTFPST